MSRRNRQALSQFESPYWRLTLKDGSFLGFGEAVGSTSARKAALQAISDRNGNQLTLTRDANYNLTRITSPSGRFIELTYDTSNWIVKAADNLNRTVSYAYDAGGRLIAVTC